MFRTELITDPSTIKLDIQSPMLSMGSCFAHDIGLRLEQHKFDILTNPGGILFNPLSILELIEMALNETSPAESTFLQHDGIYFNHKLHSEINATSKQALKEQIVGLMQKLKSSLLSAQTIILTFGTAFVYKLKEDSSLVANCHKVPQQHFNKVLLTKEEIIEQFQQIRSLIHKHNPDVKFVLTVSPVRHIKDTLVLNAVSKSTLRLACHELQEHFAETSYFPSYELMMDDLRDYRFYKSDMLHPTEQAVDYIWQKFMEAYFNERTQNFVTKWSKIKAAINHKPFHPASEAHQKFLKDLIKKTENLRPLVEVSQELALLKSQLV